MISFENNNSKQQQFNDFLTKCTIRAVTCDFQQCGILTSVDSD